MKCLITYEADKIAPGTASQEKVSLFLLIYMKSIDKVHPFQSAIADKNFLQLCFIVFSVKYEDINPGGIFVNHIPRFSCEG